MKNGSFEIEVNMQEEVSLKVFQTYQYEQWFKAQNMLSMSQHVWL